MHFCPPALLTFGTARFRRFLVDHAPFPAVQDLKGIVDIMYKTSVDILNSKVKALEEGDEETERQVAKGKDILSILCGFFSFSGFVWRERVTFWGLVRENRRADKKDRLEDEELFAQMS